MPAIGTAGRVGFQAIGEFLGEPRVCPDRFAFVAHDASRESIAPHADADTAQTITAFGTRLNVNQIG